MYSPTPDDVRLLREYRTTPSRSYSLDLHRLLTRLRTEGTSGKLCILVVEPGREWAIGQLGTKRGDPVLLRDERRFHRLADAQWALLRLRWEKHSGMPWPADLDA